MAEILNMSEREIRNAMIFQARPASLDAPAPGQEADGEAFSTMFEETDIPETDHQLLKNDVRKDILRAITRLSPREQEIITFYFGLDGK